MSASTLLSLVLVLLLSPLVSPASPAAVGGAPPASMDRSGGAWAVVHAGQLWVCWTQAPNCWVRVELEAAPSASADLFDADEAELELVEDFIDDAGADPLDSGPARWRLGFWGARSLWIELGDQRWRLDRGQQRARITDDPAPLRLTRPRVQSCAPMGQRPAIVAGRLSWQLAPRCAAVPGDTSPHEQGGSCLGPAPAHLRRPRALGLRVSMQLSATHGWTSHDALETGLEVAAVRASAGLEIMILAELSFDLGRARAQQRARAALMRRDRLRRLPPASDTRAASSLAPLLAAEARALTAVLCGEAPR